MSDEAGEATLLEPAAWPPDEERRFGGLRRLYGDIAYARLRAASVAIIGVGGVGSWTAEALARSGVASLTLFDLDHVSESNINRQVQALGSTVGRAKVLALRERIADIHPHCRVHAVEAYVEDAEWARHLPESIDAVVDACDQVRAKAHVLAWAHAAGKAQVSVGAAGGKRQAHGVAVADLAVVTHDPLLAALRQRLRREYGAPRAGPMRVRCVYSTEAVVQAGAMAGGRGEAGLNCSGYGSSVMVTASFGMAAAAEVVAALLNRPVPP